MDNSLFTRNLSGEELYELYSISPQLRMDASASGGRVLTNTGFATMVLICMFTIFALSSSTRNVKQDIKSSMDARFKIVANQPDSSQNLNRDIRIVARYFGTETVAKTIYKRWPVTYLGFVVKNNLQNGDDGSPALYNIAEPADAAEAKKRIANCPDGFTAIPLGDDEVKIAWYLTLGNTSRAIPIRQQADHVNIVYFEPKYSRVVDTATSNANWFRFASAIPRNVWQSINTLSCKKDCSDIKPRFMFKHSVLDDAAADFLQVQPAECNCIRKEYSCEDYVDAYWNHVRKIVFVLC